MIKTNSKNAWNSPKIKVRIQRESTFAKKKLDSWTISR